VLADKFQQLETEDLLELVSMVKANQTSDMYILEDGEGMIHDLTPNRYQALQL